MKRDAAVDVLFGNPLRRTSISELEKKTGIAKSTLYNYKNHPERITLRAAVLIADALKLSQEEWQAIRRK